jgi:alkyl sulfatase BDS1-like metallo-beta-lactamase superfamily hydrolase
MSKAALIWFLLGLGLLLGACDEAPKQSAAKGDAAAALKAHGKLFTKEVLTPVPGIHVAVGYGLANVIMIEGEDGVIIVDTLESRSRAAEALAALRQVSAKPVKAIILTHNHADHIYGAQVFAGGQDIPVYAHQSTSDHIDRIINVLVNSIYRRSMAMFGQLLPQGLVLNDGIGPDLKTVTEELALLRPSKTFEKRLDVTIAGVKLQLHHAPGETDDQLFVWLPRRKILLPGDNIYQTFPNLYTIRGTAHRDVMQWVRSLDKMRDLGAEVLVPSHTRPLVGGKQVAETLTAYRDGMQYVHDQTVRGMNLGLGPEQLVEFVYLPPHLAEHPWLAEHYGTVRWSVRAVFNGYLGWFSGDAVDLDPLSPGERARQLQAAFADSKSMAAQARAALSAGQYQWAAELSRYWRLNDPDAGEADEVMAAALTALGERSGNPNARNWYLTQAHELRGELEIGKPDPSVLPADMLDGLPIAPFMAGMSTRLKAEDALDTDLLARFEFSDEDRVFSMHIRRGVAALRETATPNPDIHIKTTARTWKRIVTKQRNPALAFASDEIDAEGGVAGIVKFLSLFER